MENMTNITIPKKYHHMIERVYFEGKEDGYFIELKDDYVSTDTECGLIHEWNKVDLVKALKWVEER